MLRPVVVLALMGAVVLASCGPAPPPPVEAIGSGVENVSRFVLKGVNGTRDGERLDVRAVYADGGRNLDVRLHVSVTPPAKLVSGTWSGLGGGGEVRERSLTFLGGQSSAPSVGGRFDLLGPDQRPLYRITIPLQELTQPFRVQPR
jgi:hypothetical protein